MVAIGAMPNLSCAAYPATLVAENESSFVTQTRTSVLDIQDRRRIL